MEQPIEFFKQSDSVLRVRVPFNLKEQFKEICPKAFFDGKTKMWIVNFSYAQKLEDWAKNLEKNGVCQSSVVNVTNCKSTTLGFS